MALQSAAFSPDFGHNQGGQRSGDDVGQQDILELDDAILERQLALLEALDQHPVGHMPESVSVSMAALRSECSWRLVASSRAESWLPVPW